jgi:hypothetical protein
LEKLFVGLGTDCKLSIYGRLEPLEPEFFCCDDLFIEGPPERELLGSDASIFPSQLFVGIIPGRRRLLLSFVDKLAPATMTLLGVLLTSDRRGEEVM